MGSIQKVSLAGVLMAAGIITNASAQELYLEMAPSAAKSEHQLLHGAYFRVVNDGSRCSLLVDGIATPIEGTYEPSKIPQTTVYTATALDRHPPLSRLVADYAEVIQDGRGRCLVRALVSKVALP